MKVTLLSSTPDALNLLLRTKNTRLSHAEDPATWDADKKQEHLAYMLDTIRSSWEFVSYTFQIDDVTRAFTHQLVRTRTGSYAQQSLRAVDARDFAVSKPLSVARSSASNDDWDEAQRRVMATYGRMIDDHIPAQDARGILPTNVLTNIIAQFNLRTLSDMAKLRLCTRTQGEYQDVFRAMRALVIEIHPWAEPFLEVHCVATGTCAFPRYGRTDCPVYDPAMDNSAVRARAHDKFWSIRHEAAPVALDGKAM